MTLAELKNWSETAFGLHRGALLLGAVQRLTQAPQPAYLELGLQVRSRGFESGPLPEGGKILLEFKTGSLVYHNTASSKQVEFPLDGRSQAEVCASLFESLEESELAGVLPPGADLFERLSQGIQGRGGRYRPPARQVLYDQTPIKINLQTAKNYFEAVQEIYTGMARFLAHRPGLRTPLIVWPEHFDLSTLAFSGNEIDEGKTHMNFGFAPFSGGIESPYLYAYAYPYPESYNPPDLPPGARWHIQGWTGMVLPYEAIAAQANVPDFVEMSCELICSGLERIV